MTHEIIQRVRIYINQDDRWENKPMYLAVLEHLQREGATSANALPGLAGFGPGQRAQATGFGLSEFPPVVIEWIDSADHISHMMPMITDMVTKALITVEEVQLYRGVVQAQGPFAAERSVGDVMDANPHTLSPTATLGKAVATMLAYNQPTLPIIDEKQHLLGTITQQEFARRAGLLLPLRLLRLLNQQEGTTIMVPFAMRPVVEIMNTESRTVYAGASIPQALITMIEWDYEQIPVLGRGDALVGLLGTDGILSMFVEQAERAGSLHDTSPSTSVQLVMQAAVPRILVTQPLGEALRNLLTSVHRYLVVVDEQGHVRGSLSDATVLQRLGGTERAAWLAALQRTGPVDPAELPGTTFMIADMMETNIPTLAPGDSLTLAARRLLELGVERAPVVDADGKLLGLLGRSGLLRALVQASQ